MKLTITRDKFTDKGILGVLELVDNDGEVVFSCHTAERPTISPEPNQNHAIPYGKYHLKWHQSQKFGRSPHLYSEAVPQSRYILIHVGNNPLQDSNGCVLVGKRRSGELVLDSRIAIEQLKVTLSRHDLESIEVEIKKAKKDDK